MSFVSKDPSLDLKYKPFTEDQKVKPHFSFKHYYPDVQICTIKTCEKSFCQTGWLVTVEEFTRTDLGKQQFDSSWFSKL